MQSLKYYVFFGLPLQLEAVSTLKTTRKFAARLIIRGKCKIARQDVNKAFDEAKAKLQQALDDLENFCVSE